MITPHDIEQLTNTIVEVEQPDQIILFGSYARGTPGETSDLDILVVKHYDVPRHKRGKDVLKSLSYVRFPLDILFYTPEEIEKWSHASLAFITTVVSQGKTLYERSPKTRTRMAQEG